MLIARRRVSLLLSSFLISGVVTAALITQTDQPEGYWVLENKDPEKPYGGLMLDRPKAFSLLVFDSNCQLHRVEGKIRQKEGSWELKNQADYSTVFTLTQETQKLKLRLVDTEGQVMVFTATSEAELTTELRTARRQHCQLTKL